MIKLSIIIPAYNAEPYIHELLDRLEPQVTEEVQVLVIDDGSNKPLDLKQTWIKFYSNRKNKGISYTRNRGLKLATGKYIHFIDADDLVAENYVEYIMNLIDTRDGEFDYIDLSWKSLNVGYPVHDFKLRSDKDSLPNPSASTRIFAREFIGDHRFNENKDAAEDEDFTRHLQIRKARHICATEYMYFYRTYVEDSNSKRFIGGLTNTHRVGFYYKHVRTYDILDKVKATDKYHETIVLTYQNDIPELEEYARVICPPQHTRVMEVYGEPTDMFSIIPMATRTQVVIYSSIIGAFGGIETFIFNFCKNLCEYYDITVVYNDIELRQLQRLESFVRCQKADSPIICDTLIMNRIADSIPDCINFKISIQVVHAVNGTYAIQPKTDRDKYIAVSNVVRDSYKDVLKGITTIRNMTDDPVYKKPLILLSTSRFDTPEKGQRRIKKLADALRAANIPFILLYFSNRNLDTIPEAVRLSDSDDIPGWVDKADYLVQLSDSEGMSYSILEAMEMGTRLIVTPLPMLKEIGFKDGVHGHILPFDMDEIDVSAFTPTVQAKTYTYDNHNEVLVQKWRKVLGNTKPTHRYRPSDAYKWVDITMAYYDNDLRREMQVGEVVKMRNDRAELVIGKGYGVRKG
ncbi:MAG: glycosyltransferase [Methanobrevibacter sp.]|nr:glycosyltransferase [Methanobrevibacter sp.]